MRNIFTILLLLLVGSAFAQTSFVQSRFFGMPSVGNLIAGQCESCRPSEDGILEYRLGMVALESEGVNNTATYNIQMNIIGGNTNKVATRLAFASARLTYNTDAFGKRVIESGRCHQDSTPEASPFNGFTDYKYTLRDTTDNSFTITAHITTTTIAANRLVSIDGLNDAIFVRLSCAIQETDEDAGIAISGTDILSNMVYVYNDTSEMSTTISHRRNIFPLVGNDLLGFRLDGRTYAQRYALFSDGTGINIRFSEPISTALQADDFMISTDTVRITSVSHNDNEDNVAIEFDKVPPVGSELRLSDPLRDAVSDSMGPAAGNFIASLYHDEDAPQATGIVRDSRDNSSRESEWTITFDKPLDPTTIEGNICLSAISDAYATCLTGDMLTSFEANTAQIQSVSHADTDVTTVTVVVAERVTENTTLTMSFRLNGVRGEDQRAVEEDQVALRGGVPVEDAQSPMITAQWVDSGGNAMSGNLVPDGTDYVIYFRITASENVPTLRDSASYQLRRVTTGGVASNTDGERVIITEVNAGTEVILRYTVPVSGNADVEYFTVVRNGATSLQDTANNEPIDDMRTPIMDGGIISATAQAPRNTEGAEIGVQSATVIPANFGLRYTVTFEITATKVIPTINNDTSYSVSQQGSNVTPATSDLQVSSNAGMTTATITYEVTFEANQYDDVRDITGWTLDLSALLDRDGNPPTIAADRTAARDQVSPIIRIFGTPTAVRSSENPLIYEVTFDVRAVNKNVEGLDEAGSYLLYRDTTLISNLMPDIVPESDNRQTTLTYTVQFRNIMDVRDTTNFRLRRNLETSLLDDSGNLPVDNNGVLIGANDEIDSGAFAVRPTLSANRMLRGLQLTQTDGTAIDLNPTFDSDTTTYTAVVANNVAQVTVATTATDIGATVMVNNSAAARSITTNVPLGADGTTTTIAIIVTAENGTTAQGYIVAVARQVAPPPAVEPTRITIATTPTAVVRSNNRRLTYDVVFVVEATENVPTLNSTNSYQLYRIEEEGENDIATLISASAFEVTTSPGSNSLRTTLNYVVTFDDDFPISGQADSSFSLRRAANANALLDASNNSPVNRTGDIIGTGTEIDPTSRATPEPILLSDLMLSDTEGGPIDLLDFLTNTPVDFNPTTLSYNVRIVSDSEQTTLQVTAVEDIVGSTIQISTDTSNFTVIESGVATNVPIEFSGYDQIVLSVRTVQPVGERKAYLIFLSRVDTDNPIITIATTPTATATGRSNNRLTYDVVFVVEADTEVPTLDDTNSYQLYRIEEDGENSTATLISGASSNTESMPDTRRATIRYTVTLSNQQATDTDSFALYRSSDENSLLDASNEPPVNSSGNPININTEIDPTKRAVLPSNDATLDALALTRRRDGVAIDLNPTFDSDTTTYTAVVANNVAQVTVAPMPTDSDATVTVNNRPPTDVNLGAAGTTTTIAIIVTAEDRVTTQRYTVSVGRQATPEPVVEPPPELTVQALGMEGMEAVPSPDNGNQYTLRFRVSSTESVSDIGTTESYVLLHIPTQGNDELDLADLITSSRERVNSDRTVSTLTYVVTFTDTGMTTQTAGFTLGRNGTALRDGEGNDPVKGSMTNNGNAIVDGERIDDDDGAVAERDTTPPTITIATTPTAVVRSNDRLIYNVVFVVEATEEVDTLNSTNSYQLYRIEEDGENDIATLISASAFEVTTSPGSNSLRTTLNYVVTFDDIEMLRDTRSFSLWRAADVSALLDDSNNSPVNSGGQIIGTDTEIDPTRRAIPEVSDVSTLSNLVLSDTNGNPINLIDFFTNTTGFDPEDDDYNAQIFSGSDQTTVTIIATAQDAIGATLGLSTDGINFTEIESGVTTDVVVTLTAIISIRVTAANGFPTTYLIFLERAAGPTITIVPTPTATPRTADPLIYDVVFVVEANENVSTLNDEASYQLYRVVNDTPMPVVSGVTSDISPGSDGMRTTITYTVTFTGRQQVMQTQSFALYRSSDGNSLRDNFQNQPVNIDPNTEIDSNRRAARESDGAIITVAVIDRENPDDTSNADNVEASPSNDNGNEYTISFRVENTEHDTKPIADLGTTTSYTVRRVLTADDSNTTSNLTITTATGTVNESGVATLDFVVRIDNQANTELTGGFLLARATDPDALLDRNSNPPRLVNNVISNGTAIDAAAVARRDTTPPSLTLSQTSAEMPDDNTFRLSFTVTASEAVRGIDNGESYYLSFQVTQGSAPTTTADIPTNISGSGNSATLNYSINIPDLRTALGITDNTLPYGVQLVRRGDGLRDSANNDPVQTDAEGSRTNTEVADGQPLQLGQVLLLDVVPPVISIQATTATEVTPVVNANGWQFGFKIEGITPTDVPNIEDPASYRLLGRDGSDNYAVVNTSSFPLTRVDCATPAATPADNCRVIRAEFDIAAAVANNIIAFALGRAPNALRDPANNDPVVANDTSDPARVVGTGADGDGRTILPLDLMGWQYVLDRESPSITVTALNLSRRANTITGSFNVSSDDVIDEIRSTVSYVLLRVTQSDSSSVAPINDAKITVTEQGNDGQTASIGFTVTDDTADLATLYQYTLGRRANLTDKAGNPLVYANSTTQVEVNERIDNRDEALADIPATDTRNAIITLEAITGAMPDRDDPLVYRGSFKVSSEETISNINTMTSYTFLRVDGDSNRIPVAAANVMISIPMTNRSNETTITFVTTLTSIVEVRDTRGFTLSPSSVTVLTNEGGDGLLNNLFSGTNQVAMRERDNPRLQVTMQTGQQPTFVGGPTSMTAAFRVLSSETVRGIDQAGSYQLLRLIGQNADALTIADPFNGTAEIRIGDNTDEGQLVSVAVTLDNISDVRNTYGFTLARRGDNLSDLSSNEPRGTAADGTTGTSVVQTGERIDLRTDAIWVRTDRTPPTITVVAQGAGAVPNSTDPTQYTGSFRVSSTDIIRNINSSNAYRLLLITLGNDITEISASSATLTIGALEGSAEEGYTTATVSFTADLTEDIVTAIGDDAIRGFTLGNALDDLNGLQDLSGNQPILGNQGRLDSADAAIAERERVIPVITVVAQGMEGMEAMPNPNNSLVYTGSFEVTAPDNDPVRNLNNPEVYRLLRQTITNTESEIPATLTITSSVQSDTQPNYYTRAVVSFTTTLTQSVLAETAGFTLGENRIAGFGGLQDISGNRPSTTPPLRRLDTDPESVAARDTTPPQLGIETASIGIAGDAMGRYSMSFTVSVENGEEVPTLSDENSYRLVRIIGDGDSADTTASVTVLSVEADEVSTTMTIIRYEADLSGLNRTERGNTRGFTLVRADAEFLLDRSGNEPVKADGTTAIASGDVLSAVSGGVISVVATIEREPPVLTVQALGMEGMEAVPTEGNGNQYTVRFSVSSTELVPDLGSTAAYSVVRIPSDGSADVVITAVSNSMREDISADGLETTLSYVVTLDTVLITQGTLGFTLVRAGAEADCRLCDISDNAPVAVDARLDGAATAIARRDQIPPSIEVVGMATTENEGEYRVVFNIEATKPIADLGTTSSYVLLQRDRTTGNSAPVMVVNIDNLTGDRNADNTTATISYTVSSVDPTMISGFVLGRAGTSLRDASNNDPVDANLEVDDTVENGGALDSRGRAIAVINTPNPRLTVVAEGMAMPSEETPGQYTLRFDVMATNAEGEPISVSDIAEAESYVLIRIVDNNERSEMVMAAVSPTRVSGNDDTSPTTATVEYTVTLGDITAERATAGFTLGRAAGRLTDGSNNPVMLDGTEIGDNARIDNNEAAEAQRDTMPPTIGVIQASVTRDTGNTYDISFVATRSEVVRNFVMPGSYTLLAIATEVAAPAAFTPQPTPTVTEDDDNADRVTVTYNDVTLMNPPYAFTLGRSGTNLRDLSGNAPVDASDDTRVVAAGEALDSGDAAVAIVPVPPRLTVEAVGMEAVPSEANINEYTMRFRVESTEAVADIGTTGSYVLLHIATQESMAIEDLSSFITSTTSVVNTANTQSTLSYVVTFTDTMAQTRITRGFTLGRNGADTLQDEDGNDPRKGGTTNNGEAIGSNRDRIDDDATAVAARDTTPPQLGIATASSAIAGDARGRYQMSFTVSVENGEVVPTLADENSYRLVRVIGDGSSADTTASVRVSRVDVDSSSSDIMTTIINYEANLSGLNRTERRNTRGFTLVRTDADDLLDRSGNEPVKADGTTTIASGDVLSAVSNGGVISMLATIEREPPTLTVQALGMEEMEAVPTAGNGDQYTLRFSVKSTELVTDLGSTTAYSVVRIPSDGSADVIATVSSSMQEDISADDLETTLSYVVTLDTVDITQGTSGFTLVRAGVEADCRLCDISGNAPVAVGARLDDDDTAVAERDDTPPSIGITGTADATENEGEYTVSFNIEATKPIADLGTTSSYVLLQRDSDNRVDEFPIGNILGSMARANADNTTATVSYTVSSVNPMMILSFGLRGAVGSLRDASNNDPVLDQAFVLIDRTRPRLRVVAEGMAAMPSTDTPGQYALRFNVTATNAEGEPISVSDIGTTTSYVLIRIDTDNNETVMAGVVPTRVSGNDDTSPTTATVEYTVTFDDITAERATAGFTLGRAAGRLNNPVRPADGTAIGADDRIDNNQAAEAQRDTMPPTIGVIQASVTRDTGNTYDISFVTTRSEVVRNFVMPGSYTLLAIETQGAAPAAFTPQPTPTVTEDDDNANRVTVTYEDVTLMNPPYAFTLGRAGTNLRDFSGNAPVDASNNTRVVAAGEALDSGDAAVAIVPVPPRLTVEAVGMEAVPSEANINEYTMRFRVESTEAVADIGTTGSYVLLHIATQESDTIADLSSFITSTTSVVNSDNTTATLSYVVTFTDTMTQTRITRGFTLGRDGPGTLQDEDGNDPRKGGTTNTGQAIGAGERIDDDATAVAARDTTPPQLSIATASSAIAGDAEGRYSMRFTVSVANNEEVPTLSDENSYRLVRVIGDGSSADTTASVRVSRVDVDPSSDIMTTINYEADLSGLTRTERGNTRGFTLVRADNLLDRSGNEPVQADGTTAIASGDVLSVVSGGVISMLATIEREAPTLTVQALGIEGMEAVPTAGNGNQYTLRFSVKSNELVPDLGSTTAYNVLGIPTDENAEEFIATVSNRMRENISADGLETTLSYVVTFDTVDITQGTLGFTLVRAGAEADCRLCDISGNAPVAIGARLDSAATAVAERDDTPPSIRITGTVDARENDGEYTVTFDIEATKPIADLGTTSSYVLLQRDSNGIVDEFPIGNILGSMARANADNTTATVRYTVSSVNPMMILSFGLRGAVGSLRDASNNDPVLDDAFVVIDRTRPRLRVVAEDAMPSEDIPGQYVLRFNVTATNAEGEPVSVSDIGTTSSYVLIRIDTDNNETVMAGVIPTVSANDDTSPTTATVEYTVTFDDITAERATAGFTLGRAAGRLNNPVRPADGTAIGADDRIDNNQAAVAQRDTEAPSMTVVAAMQEAVPAEGNPLTYTGTFTVSSTPTEAIQGIGKPGSYHLIRIPTDGNGTPSIVATDNAEIAEVSLTPTAGDDETNATIMFSVTLASIETARMTAAFTLGRAALPAGQGLRDLSNNAVISEDDPFRLDSNDDAEAVRDTIPPTIGVSQASITRDTDNVYDISFVATRSEAVVNFGTTGSYTLLSIATEDAKPAVFTPKPTPDNVTPDENDANSVTVTYDDVVLANPPFAFTLGRAGTNLRDLSGNAPEDASDNTRVVVAGSALDSGDGAIAIVPVAARLTVQAIGMEAVPSEDNTDQYTMTFRVESTKAIDDIGTTASYVLIHIPKEGSSRIADLTRFITATTRRTNSDNTQSTLSYVVTFENTITQARITAGFTLGRNGDTVLRDGDGFDPLKGGNTDTGGAINDGDRIDDDDTAVAETPLGMVSTLSNLMLVDGDGNTINLDETFAPTTTNYTTSVVNDVAQVRVTPTATDFFATIDVDDGRDLEQELTSGSTSDNIPLPAGKTTTITIVVTAENEGMQSTYTIVVLRQLNDDARLSNLVLADNDNNTIPFNEGTFNPATQTYTATVGGNVETVSVTPTASDADGATITVNGVPVTSGSTIDNIPLADAGETTRITIVVTAANDMDRPYTIDVERGSAGIRLRIKVFLEGPLQ